MDKLLTTYYVTSVLTTTFLTLTTYYLYYCSYYCSYDNFSHCYFLLLTSGVLLSTNIRWIGILSLSLSLFLPTTPTLSFTIVLTTTFLLPYY